MTAIPGSPLGREVAYPDRFDPGLLYPIPRRLAREALGIAQAPLPFAGHDRWHAYELSWLDAAGIRAALFKRWPQLAQPAASVVRSA